MDRKTSAYIQDEQFDVPKYEPNEYEILHISHVYTRLQDMKDHVENLGLYDEWGEAEKYYINDQIPRKSNELPKINLASEIEIVETKSSEETKVLPEVVLKPVYDDDKEKVEALQKIIEYIKEKNNDDLLKSNMLKYKNIYGVAFQKIYWKEVWRDIKFVTGEESDGEYIGTLNWKKERVLKWRDICIENIMPQHVLFSEESKKIEDANEVIQLFYFNDINKAREEFGIFKNFKYVKKGQFQDEILELFKKRDINFDDEDLDIMGMYYWNIAKDEYSIFLNGVLLTQYGKNGGNPIPCLFWKDHPFTKASCRLMPGGREFYPKGDVALVQRIKECKNVLINAINRVTQTNSKTALVVPKELAMYLQKLGFAWEDANILPVSTDEQSKMTRPITIQADINGAMALLQKLDEYQTVILGVDTHSLLSSVQETATKTAIRAETAMKRIGDGLKMIEQEALVRKIKIILALLRQYYKETEDYLDIKNLKNGKMSKVTVQKTIPIEDEAFYWTEELKPVTLEEVQGIEGITNEFIDKVFWSEDGNNFEFLVRNEDELKHVNAFKFLPKGVQNKVIALIKGKTYNKLNKDKAEGETTHLEIKKELFETEYEIKIVARGTSSYSELYDREKSDSMMERFLGNPNVNQNELVKQNIIANGINPDKLVRDEQEVAAEQEQAVMEEEMQNQQGNQEVNQQEVINQVSSGQGDEVK